MRAMTKTRIVLVAVAAIVLALIAASYYSDDHQQFLAFAERRADWHKRCDAYKNTPLTSPEARACNTELKELVAFSRQHGWQ